MNGVRNLCCCSWASCGISNSLSTESLCTSSSIRRTKAGDADNTQVRSSRLRRERVWIVGKAMGVVSWTGLSRKRKPSIWILAYQNQEILSRIFLQHARKHLPHGSLILEAVCKNRHRPLWRYLRGSPGGR